MALWSPGGAGETVVPIGQFCFILFYFILFYFILFFGSPLPGNRELGFSDCISQAVSVPESVGHVLGSAAALWGSRAWVPSEFIPLKPLDGEEVLLH